MKRLCAVILLMTFLTGCNNTMALRDEIVVEALGIHQKDGACTLSIQAVEALKVASGLSEQDDAATAVYEASGESLSAALHAFLNEAGRETYILQNRIVAVSTEQCKTQSLFDTLNYLIRSEEGHPQVSVAVCRGDPKDLLSVSSANDAIPARYLVGLLRESAEWGLAIHRRLLDVQRAASGMVDLALPILRVSDGTPETDGVALFHDGEFVGELDKTETLGLALLLDELSHALYVADGVTYTLESLKTKLTVERDGQRFAYRFSVTGQVRVTEQTSKSEVRLSAMEDYVRSCMTDALRVLDSTDCDPLGLARKTAQADTSITQETARSQLKECDKTVSVNLKF